MNIIRSNLDNTMLLERERFTIVSPFNNLPYTVKQEIFLYIDCKNLVIMKSVCLHWHKVITELLKIRKIGLPYHGAVCSSVKDVYWWDSDCIYVDMFRSAYPVEGIIHKVIIANIIDEQELWDLHKIDHYRGAVKFLRDVATSFRDTLVLGRDMIRHDDIILEFIRRLTGDDCPIEQLKKEGTRGKTMKSFIEKYTWYIYDRKEETGEVGLIALYPDNQTFTIFSSPKEYYDYDCIHQYGCGRCCTTEDESQSDEEEGWWEIGDEDEW